ncbi:MAG: glutaredoxin family protein [Elainellaceae cyanobacterium]
MTASTSAGAPVIEAPVRLYRKPSCPWGQRAVDLLNQKDIAFEDHLLRSPDQVNAFKVKHDVDTTPQIFLGGDRLGGYTDLAARLGESTDADEVETSYAPVAAVFSTAALVSLAAALGISGFMGVALSMLASLKLMDIDAFTEGFEKYDLVTQRFRPYGKVYPFAELAIGLGFLSGIAPLATGVASLAVGLSGGVSVFKAVYIDKKDLNCACVGGDSRTPLGVVSFTENAIMAIMGAILLVTTVSGAGPELESNVTDAKPAAVVTVVE